MSTGPLDLNPFVAATLDPDVVDADTIIAFEQEILIGRRSFATAQAVFGSFTEVNATFTSVSASWHGTIVSPYEGSFAVVQSGSRLVDLIGEIVRVTIDRRTVYAYVVGESGNIKTEISLTQRTWLALSSWAQRPGGLQGKVEVMV